MIQIPSEQMALIKRLAEMQAALTLVYEVLVPLAKAATDKIRDMDADSLAHAISRQQGFARGIDDIRKAFDSYKR